MTDVARLPGSRCPCCGATIGSPRGDRRFTLLDAMVLVAASAVAFVIVRPVVAPSPLGVPAWGIVLAFFIAGLVAWTPAALALRLRSPRPSIRKLCRQPGFAASLAASAILSLGVLATALLALIRAVRRYPPGSPPLPDPTWWVGVVLQIGPFVGPAVIAAWIVLAVTGRRRPSRNWLDVLGRVLGAGWVVLFLINCCVLLARLSG